MMTVRIISALLVAGACGCTTPRAHMSVTVYGVALYDCLAQTPAKDRIVRLEDKKGRVVGQDRTGIDGHFYMRAPSNIEHLIITADDPRVLKSPPPKAISEVTYEATLLFPCASAPRLQEDAAPEAPSRLPPEHLRPKSR